MKSVGILNVLPTNLVVEENSAYVTSFMKITLITSAHLRNCEVPVQ